MKLQRRSAGKMVKSWAVDLGRDGRENKHAQDEVHPFGGNGEREIVCNDIADRGEESLRAHERMGAIKGINTQSRAERKRERAEDLRMRMALGARSIAWT